MKILACVVFSSVWLFVVAAHADVVMAPPEHCPPGLDGLTSHGGPRCRPRPCEDGRTCPEDSACRENAWCQREVTRQGRRGPEQVTVSVSRCDTEADCGPVEDGEPYRCVRSHQCEPTVETPAWDAPTRTWTRVPHPATARAAGPPHPEPEPASEPEPEPEPQPTGATSDSSSGSGCAAGGSGHSSGAAILPLFIGALIASRRRT